MSLLLRLLGLAVTLLTFPASAAGIPAIGAFRHERIDGDPEGPRVLLGSSRETVLQLLGAPDVRVGNDYWIFWNFRVHPASANPHGFDALVLTFSGDVVSGLKLSDARLFQRFLAQSQLGVRG